MTMSVTIIEPRQAMTATEAAVRHLREQSRQADGAAVYLKLKESGCTGYMYVLELVDSPPTDVVSLELDDGVTLYIDSKSLPMLQGTQIDYVRNGVNSELQFNNPNAQEYCGCGESFSLSPDLG